MAGIRWILLGLGLALIAGIWWRGTRRSARAPGGSELRSTQRTAPPPAPLAPPPRGSGPDWGVSPLDPLSIHAADYDEVPVLDMPLREAAPEPGPAPAPAPVPAAAAAPQPVLGKPAQPAAVAGNPAEAASRPAEQLIISLRVCAPHAHRWTGGQLLAALERQGLVHGRYQVFHRLHAGGGSLFCVASLVEPGSFDPARMPGQEFRGISVFAVLPGPQAGSATLEDMITAVRGLAEQLSGMVQDSQGLPFSPQRAAALREEVARFDAARR